MYSSFKTTRKLEKIYKTTVFRYWTTGNTGLWSLREGKWMRWGLRSPGFLSGGTFWLHSRERDPKLSMAVLLSRDRIWIQDAWGFWKMWNKILQRRELSRKELTNLHGGSIKSSLNIVLGQVCTGWNFTRLGKEWVGCCGLNGSQSSHRAENHPISIRQSGGFLLIIQGIQ